MSWHKIITNGRWKLSCFFFHDTASAYFWEHDDKFNAGKTDVKCIRFLNAHTYNFIMYTRNTHITPSSRCATMRVNPFRPILSCRRSKVRRVSTTRRLRTNILLYNLLYKIMSSSSLFSLDNNNNNRRCIIVNYVVTLLFIVVSSFFTRVKIS